MTLNTESVDKLPCLENGSVGHEDVSKITFARRLKRSISCSQLLQIAKVILYLELGLLVGWIGCVYLWNMGNNNHNNSQSGALNSSAFSTMKFMPPDFNHFLDFQYTLTTSRDKRSSSENETKREECIRNVNATNEVYLRLIKQTIVGDDSDLVIILLRQEIRMRMVLLTWHVMTMELFSPPTSPRPTDDEWAFLATRIKDGMINNTAKEYRHLVEASGPPSQQMVDDIRTAVRSMITNYKNCEKVLPVGGDLPMEPSVADVLNQRDECGRTFVALKEDLRPFEARMVPGNASDPIIAELRGEVEKMTSSLASVLTGREATRFNLTLFADSIGNMTDEKLLQQLVEIKNSIRSNVDEEHQRKLDESGAPPLEIGYQFREIIARYMNDLVKCDEIWEFIDQVRETVEADMPRFKRDVTMEAESGAVLSIR